MRPAVVMGLLVAVLLGVGPRAQAGDEEVASCAAGGAWGTTLGIGEQGDRVHTWTCSYAATGPGWWVSANATTTITIERPGEPTTTFAPGVGTGTLDTRAGDRVTVFVREEVGTAPIVCTRFSRLVVCVDPGVGPPAAAGDMSRHD